MVRMTFTVPAAVKKKAQAQRDVNWSAVVAQAIEKRIKLFEDLDRFAQKSKLTQKDVDEISSTINRNMARHYEKLFDISSSTRTE